MTTFDPDTFATYAARPEWGGWGYIGGRLAALDNSDLDCPADPDRVTHVDAILLARASELKWTDAMLFVWANSKHGRMVADAAFGWDSDELLNRAIDPAGWNVFTLKGLGR